ncbi:MAG: ABC transporter family substrate-binding protein [Acidimicrobiia bacterium]
MVRRRRPTALLGMFVAVSLVAAACGGDDEDDATGGVETEDVREGGEIAYAAEQEPTGFNLNTSKDNLAALRRIMMHIWPYTYAAQPDFSVEPTALLDGPAEVVSEDPFTVEWRIHEDAVWSDDTPITSDDFEYYTLSCNGAIDPGEPTERDDDGTEITGVDCASTSGYDLITKTEKPDPKTFRAVFDQPYVEYEGLYGDPMPPAHVAKTLPGGWNTGFDPDPVVSGGPYQLKEYVKGSHFILERNEKWWGQRPHLDTLVYRQIPDGSTHPDALRNGEVQLIYPQPQVDLVQQVESIPGVNYEVDFGPTWEHLDFNFKNELLAVKEVRQAIAWGIDRDRYVDTLMRPFSDEAQRLDNRVFMSNQPEYVAGGQEYAERDVAKATAALEGAGFAKGSDGVYAKDGKRLSFRIRVLTPNALREQLEQLIQDDLKGVGIDIRIDNFSAPQTIGGVGSSGDFDLFIFAWVGTPFEVSGTQQIFSSDSDSNFGKYANPRVDALVKEAATILDEDERADKLNEIDALLWEDLANIPLFQKPVGLLAYSDRYANISENTTTESFFWNVLNWGIKTSAPQ